MPFSRPTLSEMIAQVKTDIQTRIPGADAQPRRSVLGVLSAVIAGAVHALFGHHVWSARQLFVDTQEAEYLETRAGLYGLERRAAAPATGTVAMTAPTDTVIPAGTVFKRSDGARYASTAEVIASAGAATVSVEAETPGAAGNTDAGVYLWLLSPLAGATSKTTVNSPGLSGGADQEGDDPLRGRLRARLQAPPQGGASHDYVAWALQMPGVTRAWCYPLRMGIGTVGLTFLYDDRADPLPDESEVTAMDAHLEPLRPVTADLYVFACAASPLNFTIDLRGADTSAIRAEVEAELADLIRSEAEPEGTLYLSRINEAISRATGEYDHVLSSPSADVTAASGHVLTMGTVTWS